MLLHSAWGGRAHLEGADVLDAFAGTGAMGLEALSRGARRAAFMEKDGAALAVLRTNITACRVGDRCSVLAGDVLAAPRASSPAQLVFVDPPYGRDLVPRAVARLSDLGWIERGGLVVAELGRSELFQPPEAALLAERVHGAARIAIWRA